MPAGDTLISDAQHALVSDLSEARAYRHVTAEVQRIETHTANVFLAGDFAYKVKKPVNFGFCDFSTLEKRRHFTERELELNLSLSDGVYLGASEVRRDGNGRHAIDGPGETVEYALRMRRLASDNALDELIAGDRIDAATLRLIARMIAAFHRDADRSGHVASYWSLPAVRNAVMSNIDRTDEFAGQFLDAEKLASIRGFSDAWLLARGSLIDSRHSLGMPRGCHGDLHAANIFVEKNDDGAQAIQIIDCIEFNDSLRIIDPAADIAFLLMDLRRLGRTDLERAFLDEYIAASGDAGVSPLLPFYSVYRATVRCMANGLIAGTASGERRTAAAASAVEYADLAAKVGSEELPQRLVVLMTGITGTGKSTVARLLATAWELEHLQTDVIRKQIAGLGPMSRTSGGQRKRLYSATMSRKTYAEMEKQALRSLETGRGAVLDGTYLGREFRRRAVAMARAAAATVIIVEVMLPETEVLRRLEARYGSGNSVSEGDPSIYARQKPQWERVLDEEADAVARVSTIFDQRQLSNHVYREGWRAVLAAAGHSPMN